MLYTSNLIWFNIRNVPSAIIRKEDKIFVKSSSTINFNSKIGLKGKKSKDLKETSMKSSVNQSVNSTIISADDNNLMENQISKNKFILQKKLTRRLILIIFLLGKKWF